MEQNSQRQQQPQDKAKNTIQCFYYLYDTVCRSFLCQFGRNFWGTFRPDYTTETKGVKYIYVTDSSDHDTKTLPAEIIRLMQDVPRANPNARILLAMEFAVQTDPNKLPLHFATSSEHPFQIVGNTYTPLLTAQHVPTLVAEPCLVFNFYTEE